MAATCMKTCTHLNTRNPSGVSTGTRTVDETPLRPPDKGLRPTVTNCTGWEASISAALGKRSSPAKTSICAPVSTKAGTMISGKLRESLSWMPDETTSSTILLVFRFLGFSWNRRTSAPASSS